MRVFHLPTRSPWYASPVTIGHNGEDYFGVSVVREEERHVLRFDFQTSHHDVSFGRHAGVTSVLPGMSSAGMFKFDDSFYGVCRPRWGAPDCVGFHVTLSADLRAVERVAYQGGNHPPPDEDFSQLVIRRYPAFTLPVTGVANLPRPYEPNNPGMYAAGESYAVFYRVGYLRVFDGNGQCLRPRENPDLGAGTLYLSDAAVSPDGKTLLVANGPEFALLDLASGTCLRRFGFDRSNKFFYLRCCWAKDGLTFALMGDCRRVVVMDFD